MKKISIEEYQNSGGEWLYIGGCYYADLENYIRSIGYFIEREKLEDYQIPVIYGTTTEKIDLDPDRIIAMLEEHDAAYEDYELDDTAKEFIAAFAKEYNEKYAEDSIQKDKSTIVELTTEERNEIMAAAFEALEKAGGMK